MTRKQSAVRLRRRQAHGVQQKKKIAVALVEARKTAKSQKKGESQVAALMERAGFRLVAKTVRVRKTKTGEITKVKTVSYKRQPQRIPRKVN